MQDIKMAKNRSATRKQYKEKENYRSVAKLFFVELEKSIGVSIGPSKPEACSFSLVLFGPNFNQTELDLYLSLNSSPF